MAQSPTETETVNKSKVACDGSEGALGHPRVWLTLDDEGKVTCPYYDKLFLLEGSEAAKKHG